MAGICSNCSTREINNHPYRVTIDSPLGARVLAIFTPALLSRLFLKVCPSACVCPRAYLRNYNIQSLLWRCCDCDTFCTSVLWITLCFHTVASNRRREKQAYQSNSTRGGTGLGAESAFIHLFRTLKCTRVLRPSPPGHKNVRFNLLNNYHSPV